MLRELWVPVFLLALVALWLYTRFGEGEQNAPHDHQPGAHGGVVVSIGADAYHAEAVFEKGGAFRLYTLGADETRVIDVEEQSLTAYVKAAGEVQAVSVTLQAAPQPGDAPGRTSQFVGQLPADLEGKPLQVSIPSLRIGGERFRVAFTAEGSGHDLGMPSGVDGEEERELYLVPGGKYTSADIEANGGMTPSQTFKGFRARHDFNPQPGDKLCPISRTKANPECAWTIGGHVYEFCCPPCIDEFVQLAKEHPDQVMAPDAYIQR